MITHSPWLVVHQLFVESLLLFPENGSPPKMSLRCVCLYEYKYLAMWCEYRGDWNILCEEWTKIIQAIEISLGICLTKNTKTKGRDYNILRKKKKNIIHSVFQSLPSPNEHA